jgi:predicted peptidase
MKRHSALIFSLLIGCGGIEAAEPRQTEESYKPADGSQGYRYLLHLPKGDKNGKKKWPLLVFLHGSGERGDNLQKLKKHGPPKIAAHKGLPFIVVSPQCPSGSRWKPKIIARMIDDVIAKHPADPKRIYLTGLSMGGFGTWATAAEYPAKFAAIAPICGGGKAEWAKKYGPLPIWNFHGGADRVVPSKLSRVMVEAIKKAGGNVTYTEYPDVGHNSWTKAYDNPKLYEWFLSHNK